MYKDSQYVPPRITLLDESAGEAVVSVWCGTDDYIWSTQEPRHSYQTLSVEVLADRFLTADGTAGRLPVLFAGGGPMVLVTHWQSLFSNGSRQGLAVYKEVVSRVHAIYGERVIWSKISELTERFLAAQTVKFEASATTDTITVDVNCPFTTDILTFSLATPWPLFTGPEVLLNGIPLPQVSENEALEAGRWMMRGSVLSVSLSIKALVPVRVEVHARPV